MSATDIIDALREPHDDTMFDYTVSKYADAGAKMRVLCQPLFDSTPIDNAYYSRFTRDRKITLIMTPIEYMVEHLKNRYYIIMKSNFEFDKMQSGFYDPSAFYITKENEAAAKAIEAKFALYNSFVILEKYEDYCDSFLVTFPTESQHNVNFCMNNAEKLKQFFESIKSEVYQLSDTLLPLPVDYIPTEVGDGFAKSHANNFFGQVAPEGVNKVHLTNREKSILYLCVQGKSANEMAHELSLSRRTIENNLARIKIKYDCRSVTHLLSLFIDPERVPR